MKKLCLGSLLKVLCQVRAVDKQSYFIVALFSFLKDHERYKDDNFQIHLKSGKYNFSEVDEMINYDKEELVNHFKNKIIPLIKPAFYRQIIIAIRDILSEDDIDDLVVIGYDNVGYTKQDILHKKIFNLEETLSNVFYYCTVLVENRPFQANIKEVPNEDYVSSFNDKADEIIIDEAPKIVTSKIPSTLDKRQFDKVFKKISTEQILYPNSNEVSIFCLDILNSLIDYDKLKDFILDNIGNYIYTRARINNYKVEGREKSINQLATKIYNRKILHNPETNHFNEILLYSFLECVLGAPKIYSKMELQFKSGEYNTFSSGIHVLSLRNGSLPFNQFIFGASDTVDTLEKAVDNSFEQVNKVLSSSSNDFELIENTILHKEFDDDIVETLYSMVVPQKGSKTISYDRAFGMFLGYSISLSSEGLSNDEYREAVKNKLETDVKNITEYIHKKINELNLENYSFYIYILPLNDAIIDKDVIIKEALEVK